MDNPPGPQPLIDTSTPPDLMNDPQYDTSAVTGDDGLNDADNCRICRGEGSEAEPLFYPCKCSGSIKHVHQECLMEWLSHSQKKHCELCKTPFRFTKLYSPNMPPSLPNGVFFHHFVLHSWRNFATWLRCCLVVIVWFGMLPYAIRQVWRLLFWFSDGGGYTRQLSNEALLNSTAAEELARKFQLAGLPPNGTSPVSPLSASQTTPASIGEVLDKIFGFLMPLSQSLNNSGPDPLAAGLFKSLFYGLGIQSVSVIEGPGSNTSVPHFMMGEALSNGKSILSEIEFLKHLTRYPSLNGLIISIAEGYIITILVVVSFILVFLIREWVVQQQPGINMGAGFNAEFAAPDRAQDQAAQAAVDQNPAPAREVGQRPIAPVRRRDGAVRDNFAAQRAAMERQGEEGLRALHHRPAPPSALNPAADIQRQLTEEPRMTEEFLAIWRRAESDPDEVLRIIERENKTDQMRYWVNAMKILQTPAPGDAPRDRSRDAARSSPVSRPLDIPAALGLDVDSLDAPQGLDLDRINYLKDFRASRAKHGSENGSSSTESWVDIPKSLESGGASRTAEENELPDNNAFEVASRAKGKGKAIEDDGDPAHDESALRPTEMNFQGSLKSLVSEMGHGNLPDSSPNSRDTLDRPHRRHNSSSQTNGNWSFKNLSPHEGAESGTQDRKDVDDCIVQSEYDPKSFGGESAATFKGTLDFPANPFNSSVGDKKQDAQIWKHGERPLVKLPIKRGSEANRPRADSGQDNPPAESWPASSESGNPLQIQDTEAAEGRIQVRELDGTTQTAVNMQEYLEQNPIPNEEEEPSEPEVNPFAPDTPLPEAREPIVARPAEPQGVLEQIADWLWGGADQQDVGVNDEHIVQDLANEAPFVPVLNRADPLGPVPEQDAEVLDAAIAAGIDPNDPDAMEDAEDFEGFMELIGMRGPVFSLIQNALFSALLLALTVGLGIWIPYNIGRVTLLLIANPGPTFKLPLSFVFSCAAFLQDFAVSALGAAAYFMLVVVSFPIKFLNISYFGTGTGLAAKWASTSLRLCYEALNRINDDVIFGTFNFAESEMFAFSAASHESLLTIKSLIFNTLEEIGRVVIFVFLGDYKITPISIGLFVLETGKTFGTLVVALPAFLMRRDSWVISLEVGKRAAPLNLELSVWGGMDRFLATVTGYTSLGFLGALYVKKGSPFSSSPTGREWEAAIIDLLNQAGGVMKVILIISIEMLVFPLYCGLLLDAALLPLFEDATIMSRVLFTCTSPLTSIFVHWFVGTCYMFHFALFVSMCRKIMRKGVLYFIRDPDDPTFHPVRDVLERNVSTQLRKILFSALVYGALVVICLGGVVWGLAFAFKGVLPIHWSSNEPVLEFPIDLLFYNFLMPLAVKFFKPSDGLHAMYRWWFQQCARMLRLTWFMFDERKIDEEGRLVRNSWKDYFRSVDGMPIQLIKDESISDSVSKDALFDPEVDLFVIRNGRYVRAPASDQVRIPKGTPIFLEVDEHNKRIDGQRDKTTGPHSRNVDMYKMVYIPPHFRLRICAFIVSVWLFAAVTGVGITIVPLVFGRQIFSRIIPNDVQKNDVYAFSIGIYILGSALYILLHARYLASYVCSMLSITAGTPANVGRHIKTAAIRVAKNVWTWSAFLFLLPTLFSFICEFYAILPMHTYFSPTEPHTIHFVQTWTLGLLYVKLTTRVILLYPESRPAISLINITRDGYLNPDARLATRSFILPTTLFMSTALFLPWAIARFAVLTVFRESSEAQQTLIYRYSYPAVLVGAGVGYLLYLLALGVKGWRMRIRDEVYLIGERLHNFQDRKAGDNSTVRAGMRRIET